MYCHRAKCSKYWPVYTATLRVPYFSPLLTTISRFQNTRCVENPKCTEWLHNDIEHFSLRKYPVCIEYLPQLLVRFSLRPASSQIHFRNNVVENRTFTEWPQPDHKHFTVKTTIYTLNTYSRCPRFIHFVLRAAIFEIQGLYRTLKSCQNYPACIEHLRPKPKFHSVSLYNVRWRISATCEKKKNKSYVWDIIS